MTLKGVLFDLDGTLIDSLPLLRQAYFHFLGEFGVQGSEAEFAALIGPPLPEIVARLCQTHSLKGEPQELLQRYTMDLATHYLAEAQLMPYARELIEWLAKHDVVLALVTSSPQAFAEAVLSRHGLLPYFKTVIGGDSVNQGKPHPECYLKGLETLGLAATMAIAVEDSLAGITAAAQAGLRCIALGNFATAPLSEVWQVRAWYVAKNLQETQQLVAALYSSEYPYRVRPCAKVRAEVLPSPAVPLSMQAEVDACWLQAQRMNPRLHDGQVAVMMSWQMEGEELCAQTCFLPYRLFMAELCCMALGLRTLGVSGIVRSGQHFILGRRSQAMTQYPGAWELMPAGTVQAGNVQNGRLDLEAQILVELQEEAGIAAAEVRQIRVLGLIEDLHDRVIDIGFFLEIEPTTIEVLRTAILKAGEHEDVLLLTQDELVAFMAETTHVMTPTVRPLLGLLRG